MHASKPTPFPVVLLVQDAAGRPLAAPGIFDVVLFQHVWVGSDGSPGVLAGEEWVFVGGDEAGLTITRESAQRLYRALGRVLACT